MRPSWPRSPLAATNLSHAPGALVALDSTHVCITSIFILWVRTFSTLPLSYFAPGPPFSNCTLLVLISAAAALAVTSLRPWLVLLTRALGAHRLEHGDKPCPCHLLCDKHLRKAVRCSSVCFGALTPFGERSICGATSFKPSCTTWIKKQECSVLGSLKGRRLLTS